MASVLAELARFLGTLVAAAAGITGTYLDGTRSAESGRLTRKGCVLVGLALLGLLTSAGAQLAQVLNKRLSDEHVRRSNEATARRLVLVSKLLARTEFPIEPLELLFTVEYSMDDPGLADYSARLAADAAANFRSMGRRDLQDDLRNLHVDLMITNVEGWRPRRDASESGAVRMLLEDSTQFEFRDATGGSSETVAFQSAAGWLADPIVTRRQHGEASQRIEVSADFSRRVFSKRVLCVNPPRVDEDTVSSSTFDLVGRELRWRMGDRDTGSLTRFGMRFSYDYGFQQRYEVLPKGREIAFGVQQDRIEITTQHLGLTEWSRRFEEVVDAGAPAKGPLTPKANL